MQHLRVFVPQMHAMGHVDCKEACYSSPPRSMSSVHTQFIFTFR